MKMYQYAWYSYEEYDDELEEWITNHDNPNNWITEERLLQDNDAATIEEVDLSMYNVKEISSLDEIEEHNRREKSKQNCNKNCNGQTDSKQNYNNYNNYNHNKQKQAINKKQTISLNFKC